MYILIQLTETNDDKLLDKMCSALRKVLARKASSSAEWTEASEESNHEQILWAWSQVVRWSKNLYSASWKPIHSGELVPDKWGKTEAGKTEMRGGSFWNKPHSSFLKVQS